MRHPRVRSASVPGFTLVELLVVIGIIAVLVAVLVPVVGAARRASQKAACLSNLKQVGAAIAAYATDGDGYIPYGPVAPPTRPDSFYPATGDVTSVISAYTGAPVGLGLLSQKYLAGDVNVLFCPGTDQPDLSAEEQSRFTRRQSLGDYYYRHGSRIALSDVVDPPTGRNIRYASLGNNRDGKPVRALAMDTNYLLPLGTTNFQGINQRTNHDRRTTNVLYADGRAVTLDNSTGTYSIDSGPILYLAFPQILKAFETADSAAD